MKAKQHWLMQRLTAILLLPLSYWLIEFLRLALNANYFEMLEWLALPLNKMALILWFLMIFFHASIGLQVVLEDYVSNRGYRFAAIWTVHAVFSILGLSAAVLLLLIR
jgi:succinate dehydrogenase / fumarate reductase membrane anchor subunit